MGGPVPMIDRVDDAFFALDSDWRFTYLNDRAQALFKRSRQDLLGTVMWDEFPETVETQFPDGFYHAMDEQVTVSFEVYHTPLETWFEARAYPSTDGLSVYMRDVTEQKERKTELAQYAAIVDAVKDGVVTLDRTNHVVSINETIEHLLGVTQTELAGEHVETILKLASVEPEYTVDIGRAINDLDVGKTSYRELEIPVTTVDGVDRIWEIRMAPIDAGREKLAAVIRDVTDSHEYERIITSLHEVTRWLLQSNDPEEICAIAVHAGSDLLALEISGVWLLDDEHGYLEPVAGTAGAHDEFGGLPRFTPGEGLVWDVFESGNTQRYDDLEDVTGVYNPDTPLRSEIIAPIGTHGVLMTGSLDPHAFDETDMELISTLVENTRVALLRTEREELLRERTERLDRQTDRLEAIASVLSDDLKRELEAVATAFAETELESDWEFPLAEDRVTTTLDRAERLVNDVREFARNASSVGTRDRIDFKTAVESALANSRLQPTAVDIDGATLRADSERFSYLLETVFDDIAERAAGDATIKIGLTGFDSNDDGEGSRGFYVAENASTSWPSTREYVLDHPTEVREYIDGFGLAVARIIADAHDWSVSISDDPEGETRFEVQGVTTLERP